MKARALNNVLSCCLSVTLVLNIRSNICCHVIVKCKGKVLSYSLPNVGSGADPSVQAVSPQVTIQVIPGSRLPLYSARPEVTFPAEERHRPLTSTKLYCLVTEAHRCEQLAQGCYAALSWWESPLRLVIVGDVCV